MVNGLELNIRQAKMITIALWINHSDYRDAKDLFYNIKKLIPIPKNIDFDFAQHPKKYYKTKENPKFEKKNEEKKE